MTQFGMCQFSMHHFAYSFFKRTIKEEKLRTNAIPLINTNESGGLRERVSNKGIEEGRRAR